MFAPTEFIVRERVQEYEREVERIQLLRLVRDGLTDQLERHGTPLFQNDKKATQPKTSKN